jgi:hypothetical protein
MDDKEGGASVPCSSSPPLSLPLPCSLFYNQSFFWNARLTPCALPEA